MRTAAVLALGASVLASAAVSAPRDGRVEQAIADTQAASLVRRGYNPMDPKIQASIDRAGEALDRALAEGVTQRPPPSGKSPTWYQVLVGISNRLPWPFPVGREKEPFQSGGGVYGGGGAEGDWVPYQFSKEPDCTDVSFNFDAQGNLIVPSYYLPVGGPILLNSPMFGVACTAEQPSACDGSVAGGTGGWMGASSAGANVRRRIHNFNMNRIPQKWYGVIGKITVGGNPECWAMSTVAFRDNLGALYGREEITSMCASPTTYTDFLDHQHQSCPADVAGGTFHFYGYAPFNNHIHTCVHYAPNRQLGPDGYAINPFATIDRFKLTQWPADRPPYELACRISADFLKRLTDALWKDAEAQPGYDGAPSEVTDEDPRPGDTKVEDLADKPGDTAPAPGPNVDDPPVPPPTTTPPGTDLGPNPNTPAPTVDAPPTGTSIMDPFFNWLPDLPSIQLDLGNAPCPTWEMSPFDWHLVMDSHCQFIEANRALISTIMIVAFTIGAAMIILRA